MCKGAHRLGLLDRTSAVLMHQLPCPAEVSTIDPGQERVGPDGQHSDSCVYIHIYTGPAGIALLKIKVLYLHQWF